MTICNFEELLDNAASQKDRFARELALGALNEAIVSADPARVVKERVKLEGHQLLVNTENYDLTKVNRIFVIGGGKGCVRMAVGIQEVLDGRITAGYLNVLRGTATGSQIDHRIKLNEASHPLPDEAGVAGARKMKELVKDAEENDLVICLISGGGSALIPLPKEGVTLDDEKTITKALLDAGATINETNSVRKHLSAIKGGWLAKSAGKADILTLIISDVVGDPLDVIASGPTVPDTTTYADAISVLRKYRLWERTPDHIQKMLSDGSAGKIAETPKPGDEAFSRVRNYVLFNGRQACEAASSYMRKHGIASSILSTTLEGEASQIGATIGSIAKEMALWNSPLTKPAAVLAGGETTVSVRGKGIGGRNQEVTLAAALKIASIEAVAVASIGTDGIDGPTDAAGAIADGKTITRAEAAGLSATDYLVNNDSYHFFTKLKDRVVTGPTGTNVNDIAVIVALKNP